MGSLLDEIMKIRTDAARFYGVDFHMHSPCSYDWNNSAAKGYVRNAELDRIPCTAEVKQTSIKAYCELCGCSNREIAVIADHNRFGFARKAASAKDGGIKVFPAIELSTKLKTPLIKDYRIHVIAVFQPGTDYGSIDRLLPEGSAAEGSRTGQEVFEYRDVDELLQRIRKEDGIAIAAHIYGSSGARYAYTKSAELIMEEGSDSLEIQKMSRRLGDQVKEELYKFDCLQVKANTDPVHFHDDDGELIIPLIIGSDCHAASALGEKCNDITYVKMGEPSFAALKEALKFPSTRIRFRQELPEIKPPVILGVRIFGKSNSENSFFEDIALGFSDNLTCIIGPRGSGKSATIDGIRYLMGYNRTLNEIQKVKDQVTERQKHTLAESSIELLYKRSDGTIYLLRATFDPKENYNTKVYDLDGNPLNIDDVEKCKDYPLNLYGWNELELLAESPQTQRELLDRFIPELTEIKDRKKMTQANLASNRLECVAQLNILDRYFSDPGLDFRRLHEFESEYNALNTKEIEAVFSALDIIGKKKNLLARTKQSLSNASIQKDSLKPFEFARILPEDPDIRDWAKDLLEKRMQAAEFDDWLRKQTANLEAKVSLAASIIEAEEKILDDEESKAFKAIHNAIGEEEAITGDLRNAAKKRYEEAKSNFDAYKKNLEHLKGLLNRRSEIINRFNTIGKEIFATRNKQIKDIEDKVQLVEDLHFQIKLKLNQLGDKRAFLGALKDGNCKPSYHGNWKARRIPEILANRQTPIDFVAAIFASESEKLLGQYVEEGTKFAIDKIFAKKFIEDNTPFENLDDFDTIQYDNFRMQNLLELQETDIDDEFYIELSGKPIQYCSPGQRCSAMLPIVTLTSTAPLIIDQPEDNLDNRLVSKALFKILSKLKESRQIILATHNPNILVCGDAEQVLVLDNSGKLEDYGCIDKPTIVKTVISLMEGGKEAFEKREKKYEPFIHAEKS